jgi:tryptophan-rich sensory protein
MEVAMSREFARNRLRTTGLCLLAAVGALFLAQLPNDTQSEWFRSLARPDVLPRTLERKIGLIWTAIFLLTGVGTAAVLSSDRSTRWKVAVVVLNLTALTLNLAYTCTFTRRYELEAATWVAGGLAGVLAALVGTCLAGRLWVAAACHAPHLVWVCFATLVTARMAELNP